MKKIIVGAIAATALVVGLAACSTEATVTADAPTVEDRAPKANAPEPEAPQRGTDVPDSVDAAQWAVIEETGADVGFSPAETAEVVDAVAYVWATEDMTEVCEYLYDFGAEATVDAILEVAFDGTTPYDWSTVWAVATGFAIDNNCGVVYY